MKRSDCIVSYDSAHERLVYRGSQVGETHWDQHWASSLTKEAVCRSMPFVNAETKKRLPEGSKILDAGCGLSHTVWGLHHAGFEAYGVDYAPETVRAVNRLAPELKVTEADVRKLPFDDDFFDGIWSLGVIEHFPEGYTDISKEMWRVLRPGGYAFVTAPSMSPMRRIKAKLNLYPSFDGNMNDFYQFILSPKIVIERFTKQGWIYDAGQPRSGFKGFKDEAGPLFPLLQSIQDSKLTIAKYFRGAANLALTPLSFHSHLYRFRKPDGSDIGFSDEPQ